MFGARESISFSRGCNADPIYGKLQGDGKGMTVDECSQDGETPISIPGVLSADLLTCCSTDGCNTDGGAVHSDDDGPHGSRHNSAGRITVALRFLAIAVAYLTQHAL